MLCFYTLVSWLIHRHIFETYFYKTYIFWKSEYMIIIRDKRLCRIHAKETVLLPDPPQWCSTNVWWRQWTSQIKLHDWSFPFHHGRWWDEMFLACLGRKHSVPANRRTTLSKLSISFRLKYSSCLRGYSSREELRKMDVWNRVCQKHITHLILYELGIGLLERVGRNGSNSNCR